MALQLQLRFVGSRSGYTLLTRAMKLTYLPVRGRAEPILLLLIDAGAEFEQEIITVEQWRRLKAKGKNGPPDFPFAALPVLTFGHGARGGNDSKLAETGAILMFLEGKLSPPGAAPSPPDAKARLEMIRCASSFLLSRLFLSVSPTWLSSPSSRHHLLRTLIIPYLSSLSYHLSSSFFPPLLTKPLIKGQPGTSLSPAAASAYTALELIQSLFPTCLGRKGMQERYPRCEELRKSVEERPRIKAWIESGKRAEEWTVREGGELESINEFALRFGKEDDQFLEEGEGEEVGLKEAKRELEMETGE